MGRTAPRATRRRPVDVRRLAVIGVVAALLSAPAAAQARLSDAPLPTWQTNGRVDAIARAGGVVYVAGSFSAVTDTAGHTAARANAAAFDAATGAVLPWAPNPNAAVHAVKVAGSAVYLGGPFTSVAGTPRLGVAAVSSSGVLLPWQAPVTGGMVHDLVVAPTRVYLAGSFLTVDGLPRPYLASVSASTGALDRHFTAQPDGVVWALRGDASRLLIGGAFHDISGRPAGHLAPLSYASGALLPWRSRPYDAVVLGIAEASGVVYAALAGNGGRVVAYAARTGTRLWQTWFDGNVKAVTVAGGVVAVGGHFQNLCAPGAGEPCVDPVSYPHLLSLWPSNGHPVAGFRPNLNSPLGVYALLGLTGRLYVGGDFTRVNHQPQRHFTGFGALPTP